MKKNSYLTVTDQFCGAGGSSQGVRRAARKINGLELKLAMNHWKLAVDTHNTNFPEAIHECTDISAADPRRYPSTDILITSPECTNQSGAKGKKKAKAQMDLFKTGKLDAAAERSRATMWDVPRFAEYHKYNAIIVENVVEARDWIMWSSWLHAMHSLGYNHKCVYLNSMHAHPTPQSRDRMYVVFWKKGNRAPMLEYMPLSHCPKCSKNVHAIQSWKRPDRPYGKYRTQYVYCCPVDGTVVEPYYYAAINIIDWSDKGKRIGDRRKPLAPNTRRRVDHGLTKYNRLPFITNDQQTTGVDCRVRGMLEATQTASTNCGFKIVSPPPFIVKLEHASNSNSSYTKTIEETIQTQTVTQSMGLVSPPFLVANKGQSLSHSIAEPARGFTTTSDRGLVTTESWNSFIASYYGGSDCVSHITSVIGTQTTHERSALVTYQKPQIEDCYYRMLKPHEIKLGMAFDKDYIVLGTSKDQVKQLGNAVTPPAMEWLIERVVESLN